MTHHRIFAAFLLGALAFGAGAIVFSASAVQAQGYGGVMAAEGAEFGSQQPAYSQDAMPFQAGGNATVTGGGESADNGGSGEGASDSAAMGGFEMDGKGLDDSQAADSGTGAREYDPSDIYGLHSNSAMSQQYGGDDAEEKAPSGFYAAIADKTPKNELDPVNDPGPTDFYSAVGNRTKDENQLRRERVQRAVKAAEARQQREIKAMNEERLRGHQVQMQEEVDRIREQGVPFGIPQETQDAYEQMTGQTAEDSDDAAGEDPAAEETASEEPAEEPPAE